MTTLTTLDHPSCPGNKFFQAPAIASSPAPTLPKLTQNSPRSLKRSKCDVPESLLDSCQVLSQGDPQGSHGLPCSLLRRSAGPGAFRGRTVQLSRWFPAAQQHLGEKKTRARGRTVGGADRLSSATDWGQSCVGASSMAQSLWSFTVLAWLPGRPLLLVGVRPVSGGLPCPAGLATPEMRMRPQHWADAPCREPALSALLVSRALWCLLKHDVCTYSFSPSSCGRSNGWFLPTSPFLEEDFEWDSNGRGDGPSRHKDHCGWDSGGSLDGVFLWQKWDQGPDV